MDGDLHQDIVGSRFGILDDDVPVAVLVEDPGVEQLEFGEFGAAAAILVDQQAVGKLVLRILVEHLQVGMAQNGIEVIVELLDVLPVIAFGVVEAEEALLEDRILAIPKAEGEAEQLPVIAESGDYVLAPAVGPAARVVMGQIGPGRPAAAVILAHGAPWRSAR